MSAAMMLRYSFDMEQEAAAIENAVSAVLDKGYRTADIMPKEQSDKICMVGCREMGNLIVENLKKG